MPELWSACLGGALTVSRVHEVLAVAGFEGVEVEILRTYGPADLGPEGEATARRLGVELEAVQGLFASAMIRAVRP